MKNNHYFFRICKKCGEILKFEEKNKIEVLPCYCKKCKKRYEIQEARDLIS